MCGRKYLRHVQPSDDTHTHIIYMYISTSIWCTLAIYIIIYIVLLFPRFRVPTSGSILILKNTLLSTATIVYTIYIYKEDIIGVKSLLPDQPFLWTAVPRVKQFLLFSGTDFFISWLPYTPRERRVFMSFISSSALSLSLSDTYYTRV